MEQLKQQGEQQFIISHTGNQNPLRVKLPMYNGKAATRGSIQIQKMDITGLAGQSVVHLFIDRVSDLYSVNGSKHGLVMSIHRLGPMFPFQYQSELGNYWGIGSNPLQFELKLLDNNGQLIKMNAKDVWSVCLNVMVQ